MAFRAFWIGLVLLGVSLWAIVTAPGLSHARQAFGASSFDQAVKLAPADDARGLGAKLDAAKSHHASIPGDHPAIALVPPQSGGASIFFKRAAWSSLSAEGSRAQAHHYSATGPPGYRPS